MRVLVTGANGFLGRAIARQLVARGDRVRGLVRRADHELSSWGVELALGDIRNAADVNQACMGMDAVIHTAAIAGIWGPWKLYYETNVLGTEQVLTACRNQSVGKLVYTSSPSVTFDGAEQCGIDETAPYPTTWLSHYPHTKALAERQVLSASSNTLITCALRPHLIWGPGDRQLLPRLWQRAREKKLRRVGAGQNLVDMVYVDNAAEAHLLALDALAKGTVGGKAYFISQGEPVNCWQWIDELLALQKLGPVQKSVSLATAYRVGAILEKAYGLMRISREPPMTRFLAKQLGLSHYFSLARAREELGYAPRVSTAEGMRRVAEWVQQSAGQK